METQNTKIQTSSDKSSSQDNTANKQGAEMAQGSQGSGNASGGAGGTTNGTGGGIGVQQLSLPKGGGALAGSGEKVQVQDFNR